MKRAEIFPCDKGHVHIQTSDYTITLSPDQAEGWAELLERAADEADKDFTEIDIE